MPEASLDFRHLLRAHSYLLDERKWWAKPYALGSSRSDRFRSVQRSSTASIPTLSRSSVGGKCSCPGILAPFDGGLDRTKARGVLDETQSGAHGVGGSAVAPHIERDDRAEALELASRGLVGWVAREARIARQRDARMARKALGHVIALCCARSSRSASVLAPRTARNASRVPGVAPVSSRDCRNAASKLAPCTVTTPPSRSECPPMNFVTDCTATSAPRLSGR